MKKYIGVLSALLIMLTLSGCSSEVLTQEQLKEAAVKEAQEKKVIEEKKVLSDFVNLAYNTTTIEQMPRLVASLEKNINSVTQESSVKMMLHLEMAQRIVLQNDADFGAVDAPIAKWLTAHSQLGGIITPEMIQTQDAVIQKEVAFLKSSYLGIQKLGNIYYLSIDFSKYTPYIAKLSSEYAQYQKIMADETSAPAVLDQTPQLAPTAMLQRILMVDAFYRDNPIPSDGIIQNNMSDEYKMLIRLALFGTNQNSNWNPDNTLKSEWQSAMTALVIPPESKLSIPLNTLRQTLATSLWVKTPAVDQAMQEVVRAVNDITQSGN